MPPKFRSAHALDSQQRGAVKQRNHMQTVHPRSQQAPLPNLAHTDPHAFLQCAFSLVVSPQAVRRTQRKVTGENY